MFVSHELLHNWPQCDCMYSAPYCAQLSKIIILHDPLLSLSSTAQNIKIHTHITCLKRVKERFEKFLLEIHFLDDFSEVKRAIKFQEENMQKA